MTPIRTLLLILCLLPFSATAENVVTIRADNWYPMNGDPQAELPGYMIELASVIFKEHGYSVNYENMPWKRALSSVGSGKFDCVVGAYKEDAEGFLFPEESWGLDQADFFVKKGNPWRYNGLESLKDKKIGLIGGYAYADDFDKHVEASKDSGQFQFLNADNALEQNIKKVLHERIDATVESPPVMKAKLKELKLSGELVSAGRLADSSPMYIACSPANKERSKKLVNWVDEGTRKLRESGELQKIMEKYGLSDWKE